MMTPRIMTALSCAVILSVPAVSATAASKAPQGPKKSTFTCEGTVTGELALLKGNKYTLDDGEVAKFVYQTGRDKVRFKTGALVDHTGTWDRATEVLTLVSRADGTESGSCSRAVEEPVVEEPVDPPVDGD